MTGTFPRAARPVALAAVAGLLAAAAPQSAAAASFDFRATIDDQFGIEMSLSGWISFADADRNLIVTSDEVTEYDISFSAWQEFTPFVVATTEIFDLFVLTGDGNRFEQFSFGGPVEVACYDDYGDIMSVTLDTRADLQGGTMAIAAAVNTGYDDRCDDFTTVDLFGGSSVPVDVKLSPDLLATTPLPASLPALLAGIGALALLRRRRR